jgi:hypothetical protein
MIHRELRCGYGGTSLDGRDGLCANPKKEILPIFFFHGTTYRS